MCVWVFEFAATFVKLCETRLHSTNSEILVLLCFFVSPRNLQKHPTTALLVQLLALAKRVCKKVGTTTDANGASVTLLALKEYSS